MARLLVSLVLALVPFGSALEQNGPAPLSFGTTLESIKINARPEQVITRQFQLTLDAHQPTTRFGARVEDWWRSEDGKQSFYAAPGTLRRSCGKWVSVNPVESTVRPGESLTVRLTAAVPAELAPGGFWCVLTVDQLPDANTAGDSVGVQFVASISTGIFIYIDPVQRDAEILDLQVHDDIAEIRVRNLGNAPIGVEGRLEFYGADAKAPAATVDMPRTTVLTEPFVEGVLAAALPTIEKLPTGRYRARAILDFGSDHYIGAEREIDLDRRTHADAPAPRP